MRRNTMWRKTDLVVTVCIAPSIPHSHIGRALLFCLFRLISLAWIPARVYRVCVGLSGLSSCRSRVSRFLVNFRLVSGNLLGLVLLRFGFHGPGDSSGTSSTISPAIPSPSAAKPRISARRDSIAILVRCSRRRSSTASARVAVPASSARRRISAFDRGKWVRRTGHPAVKSGKAKKARFRLSGGGQCLNGVQVSWRMFLDFRLLSFVRREKLGGLNARRRS